MKGVSMFSGAGIGELMLEEIGFNVVVANEIIEKRGELYKKVYPNSKMIIGDIQDSYVFREFVAAAGSDIDFLIASPPCQGVSIAGKNRCKNTMLKDKRNYLIYYVVKMIHELSPQYVLIENVPKFINLYLPHNGELKSIEEILSCEFDEHYIIESKILNAADYGVPQIRKRAIIKLYKKGLRWPWPQNEEHITVADAIGHLPSLESGESSEIKWHFARKHIERHVIWMKNTPTGKSAFENKVHYPKKKDGTRIKGYKSTYRRIDWDKPAPTITIRNDAISSQRNVHPGRPLPDGTYSDARVLTPLELMILNSIPENWKIPDDTPEILIRQVIGESIPPLMVKKIMEEIINE